MGRKPKEEGIYVYMWLIYFVVQQKLTQHYKATITQQVKVRETESSDLHICFRTCVIRLFSRVSFVTPWTVAARLLCPWDSPGKKLWSGLPSPPQKDLPDPGVEATPLMSPASGGRFFTISTPGKPLNTFLGN